MKTVSSASVAKISSEAETVTDVGAFDNDEDQQNYLNQYLPRGYLDAPAGTHLASRIIYWLHGRFVCCLSGETPANILPDIALLQPTLLASS
jgi:hypothetical protein